MRDDVAIDTSTRAPPALAAQPDEAASLRAENALLRQQLAMSSPGPLDSVGSPSFPYAALAVAPGGGGGGGGILGNPMQLMARSPLGAPTALSSLYPQHHGQQPLHPAVQFMHALTARSQSDAWLSALMFAAPNNFISR